MISGHEIASLEIANSAAQGTIIKGFSDTISFSDALSDSQLISIADSVAFSSVFALTLIQHQYEIADEILFSDESVNALRASVADLFVIEDTVTIAAVVEAIADAFGISDELAWQVTVSHSISDSLGFSDEVALLYRLELADTFAFVDTVAEKIRATLSFLDSISLSDSFAETLTVAFSLSDSFDIEDTFSNIIETVLSISDTFGLVGKFRVDGETYLVWGVNPESLGAYELAYPMGINSIERIGGKNLLCANGGIYEITGDDDDGTSIENWLKTGFVDFNDPERHLKGERLKQLLNAYLISTAEGETLLKVTTTRRGKAVETWFKCRETSTAMSKKIIPLSNSLRSVLFQFELKPLNDLPTKIRAVEVVPLFLNRSI